MSKVEFVKNDKENEPRILVFVDGIKIDTVTNCSVIEYTSDASFHSCCCELGHLIKVQTGLDVSYFDLLFAYEQYKKENK
jgi:hypothetical protein